MKIKPIRNSGGIPGGCAKTILGTTLCPVCENLMYVEVAKAGDSVETVRFICHEKLGGGYCPGSYINAKKLQAMTEAIQAIQNLGFVIADIIDFDPAGEVQRVITYLPGKACLLVASFNEGEFISASMEGQLQSWTIISRGRFVDEWSKKEEAQMVCWSTRIDEKYLDIRDQGKFTWDNFSPVSFEDWIKITQSFMKAHKVDIGEVFYCGGINCMFARYCSTKCCLRDFYTQEDARAINSSVIKKFPEGMFSENASFII